MSKFTNGDLAEQSAGSSGALHDNKEERMGLMANRKFTPEEARERKNQRQKEYNVATNYAPQREYNKERGKNINFRVFVPQDNDILEFLETLPNKAGYLKDLIRADIKRRIEIEQSQKED